MANPHELSLWTPIRRFLGLSADKSCNRPAQARSLLFQLVESEICAADALLDLNDFRGCDHHLGAALHHAEGLQGPENLLMHRRLSQLQDKRANFKTG